MNTEMETRLSHQFIDDLCSDENFIQRVQSIIKEYQKPSERTLSMEINDERKQPEIQKHLFQSQTRIRKNSNIILHQESIVHNLPAQRIQIEQLVTEITHSMMEIVFQQTNQAYSQNIRISNEIQKLKEAIEKITVGSEIRLRENSKEKEKTGADSSIFFENALDSSIEIKNLRKPATSDKLESLSFINSFINQNAVGSDEISDKINASISKVESNIQDRLLNMEKEFTRRIQQVMKTIKHIIFSMSEEENQDTFKKRNSYARPRESITQFRPMRGLNIESPQLPSSQTNSSPLSEIRESFKHSQKNTPIKKTLDDTRSLLDKSQSRISSFFGLGGSGKGK